MRNTCHSKRPAAKCNSLSLFYFSITKAALLILDIPFFSPTRRLTQAQIELIVGIVRPGDIVMTSDRLFPVWQLLVKSMGRSNYCHAAICEGGGCVIEATTFHPSGDGVARTPIGDYIRGYKTVCVLRPPYGSPERIQDALSYARRQLGRRYDFRTCVEQQGTMYCTKLVAQALLAAGLPVDGTSVMGRGYYVPDDFIRAGRMDFVYGAPMRFRRTVPGLMPLPLLLISFSALVQFGVLSATGAFICAGAALAVYVLLGLAQLRARLL